MPATSATKPEPHATDPLFLAIRAQYRGRQDAAADFQRRYQDAYAGFLEAAQKISAETWQPVTDAQSALITASAGPEASVEGQQSAYASMMEALQEFQSGAPGKDALTGASEAFQKAVAEATAAANEKILASESAYIQSLKDAFAAVDPDALDAETLAALQRAVMAAVPTADLASAVTPPKAASAPETPSPAKTRQAKAEAEA